MQYCSQLHILALQNWQKKYCTISGVSNLPKLQFWLFKIGQNLIFDNFEKSKKCATLSTGQLCDTSSKIVPLIALNLLDEAADDKMNLEAMVCSGLFSKNFDHLGIRGNKKFLINFPHLQCENSTIFLPLRVCNKLISVVQKREKLPFCQF